MTDYIHSSLNEFAADLASAKPAPGGGGAAALTGALGCALASMVTNFTVTKKKYAEYAEQNSEILLEAEQLRNKMLVLINQDAEAFEPLSKAYSLPKDDPASTETLEKALQNATLVPLSIMDAACKGIELHEKLLTSGSKMLKSDIGVGAALCKSALLAGSLNVFINTRLMKNRDIAHECDARADEFLQKYLNKADEIFAQVSNELRA